MRGTRINFSSSKDKTYDNVSSTNSQRPPIVNANDPNPLTTTALNVVVQPGSRAEGNLLYNANSNVNSAYVRGKSGGVPAWLPIPGISGTTSADVPINNSVFIDSVYGNDGTGVRENLGKPFATLSAANGVYNPGDVLIFQPGTYTFPLTNITQNMSIYLNAGVQLTLSGLPTSTITVGITGEKGSSIAFTGSGFIDNFNMSVLGVSTLDINPIFRNNCSLRIINVNIINITGTSFVVYDTSNTTVFMRECNDVNCATNFLDTTSAAITNGKLTVTLYKVNVRCTSHFAFGTGGVKSGGNVQYDFSFCEIDALNGDVIGTNTLTMSTTGSSSFLCRSCILQAPNGTTFSVNGTNAPASTFIQFLDTSLLGAQAPTNTTGGGANPIPNGINFIGTQSTLAFATAAVETYPMEALVIDANYAFPPL